MLCEYLREQEDVFKDRVMLEIGSGTGLAGLCAWKIG